MTTKDIENIAYNRFWKKGWYGVFEVAIPRAIVNKYHRERVDFLTHTIKDLVIYNLVCVVSMYSEKSH